MTHDEMVARIPDFVEGRLAEAELAGVKLHVDGCDDCRALSEGYRVIARGLRSSASAQPADHPSSTSIVAYATGLSSISPAEHLTVARHLDACESCTADVEATRAVERESAAASRAAESPRSAAAPRWRGLAAAAVIGAVAMGYPLYRIALGPGAAGSPPASDWSGALPLPVVSSTLRGGDDAVTTVKAVDGQPVVAFAVSLPAELSASGPIGVLEFAVVRADGAAAWSRTIDGAASASLLGPSGALLLVVPAPAVPPGEYTVRVSKPGTAEPAPVLEAPLRVVR